MFIFILVLNRSPSTEGPWKWVDQAPNPTPSPLFDHFFMFSIIIFLKTLANFWPFAFYGMKKK